MKIIIISPSRPLHKLFSPFAPTVQDLQTTPDLTSLRHFYRKGRRSVEPGGAGVSGMRTWIEILSIIGVPNAHWADNPFLAWPVQAFRNFEVPDLPFPANTHPIRLARHWRAILDGNPSITPSYIAQNQNITPARVRQILRLLTLDPSILEAIRDMEPQQGRWFGEKRLRSLIPLSRTEQKTTFHKMCTRYDSNSNSHAGDLAP